MSNLKLREVIKQIRTCKTAAEERAVISKESALIRNAFKSNREDQNKHRNRNIAKLLFFNLLGYPTHFGQFECIKCVSSTNFTEKRIGYLGLSQLMDESTEILMMVTQSIQKDLNNSANNYYVTALALTAIAEISTSDMCKSVYLDVKKQMKSSSNLVKTKSCLAALRIIKQMPESIDDFLDALDNLIYEKSQPVLMATVTFMIEVCRHDKKYSIKFKKYVSNLVRILKNLLMGSSAPDCEVGGVKDPFLQVKILELFGYIGHKNEDATDEMSDILAHIATNTETTKNPGNSVLSECARTIMRIEASQGLRVLGINILGRFLTNRENNVRYVALNQLIKVVDIDYNAVQRHKTTITDCLKDHDMQIKKQALDLIYKITNDNNVKGVVKELTNYLVTADNEFKKELSNKICQICEKYAPNKKWHIDTVIKVLTLTDGHMREEYISQIITVIATTPELHNYAVIKVYFAMKENLNQIGLVQLGVWLIGEFGEMLVNGTCKNPDGNPLIVDDSEIIDIYEQILKDHQKKGERSDIVIMWSLTALSKLSIRIGSQTPTKEENGYQKINERIKAALKNHNNHMNIEIQQRACEFTQILDAKWDQERGGIFEPMPFKGDENMLVDAKNRAALDVDEGDNQLLFGFDDNKGASSGNAKAANADDGGGGLLDLDMMLSGPSNPTEQPMNNVMGGDMMDLFGSAPVSNMPAATDGNNNLGDLFGGAPQQPVQQPSGGMDMMGGLGDIFGGGPQAQQPPMGGGMDLMGNMGNDGFGSMQSSFPSFVAYEDEVLCLAYDFKRDSSAQNSHIITAHFKNKKEISLSGVNMQVAAQKYMTLKMKPASGSTLSPFAHDLSQEMGVVNNMEGQKPLSFKLKINYTIDNGSGPQSFVKVVSNCPTNY